MDELIKKQIYALKRNTVSNIDRIQKYQIPSIMNFIKLTSITEYTFEGSYFGIHDDRTNFYIINNLLLGKSTGKESCYIDAFSNLVRDGWIQPFLLFIDNKLIKWSDMTIVKDYNYTFLIVKGRFTDHNNYRTVLLPCKLKYGEDSKINANANLSLNFNKDGVLSDDMPISTRIELISDNIAGETFILDNTDNWFSINSNNIITNYNMLIFRDGLLYTDGIKYIKDMGLNIFKYTSVDDLANHTIVVKIFYDKNMDKNKNLINRFNYDAIRKDILERVANTNKNTYLDKITDKFDFDFTNDSANENLSSAYNYINSYDQLLFSDIYKDISITKSLYLTGKDLKDRCKNNFVTMSRRMNSRIMGVMIFRNQRLYEYHYTLTYNANLFSFYVPDSVIDSDKFEIMYFNNTDDPFYELIVKENQTITIDNFDIDEIDLYCHEVSNSEYELEDNDSIQYKVDFTYEKVGDKYIINLTDPFYYGKVLTLSSRNQYHYTSEVAAFNKMYIELTSEFKFAQNVENYMLFINGQKIPSNMIHLISMKSNQPYDTLALFTNKPIYLGDVVDVFYVPEYVNKFELSAMGADGLVETKGALDFNVDKYIYTFYINGYKIHPDLIDVVSKNNVRISKNIGSIKNIEIYQYFNKLPELETTVKDKYNVATSVLTNEEFNRLFKSETHEDNEDIIEECVDNMAVNYEIANAYHRRENLADGSILTYHVDDIFSDEDLIVSGNRFDDSGNYIINLGVAVLEDKAPIHIREDNSSNYNRTEED